MIVWKAENLILTSKIYSQLFYHLHYKIPWINLPKETVKTLLNIKIDDDYDNEETEHLILQFGNDENSRPYLASFIINEESESLSNVAIFEDLSEYIVLHYTRQQKAYAFKVVANENSY